MNKVVMGVMGMAFALMATNASAVLIEDFGLAPGPGEGSVTTLPLFRFVDPGMVDDEYQFTLDQEALVSISVESTYNELSGVVFLDIDGLQATLTGPGISSVFDGVDVPDNGAFLNSGTLTLGSGDYSLVIMGESVGRSGGGYVGGITVVTDVSAIPVPAAGLLFFSGIAALGLVRSRRASA